MADRYCDNCTHSIRIGSSWHCGNARAEDYTYPVEAEERCEEWEEADT